MIDKYDLLRSPQPLVQLEKDYDFFSNAIAFQCHEIAASYHCDIKIPKHKLLDIYAFWTKDIERNSANGFRQRDRETNELIEMSIDHVKRSALLAFWIRRLQPITLVNAKYDCAEGRTVDDTRIWQDRFMAFDNEICGFVIGLQLTAIYEPDEKPLSKVVTFLTREQLTRREQERSRKRHLNKTKEQNFARGAARASEKLSHWDEVRDYLMVMKYKSLSPYSLYLIYKALVS